MTETVTFSTHQMTPMRAAVLKSQGIPAGKPVSAEIDKLCTAALELLGRAAVPLGVFTEVSQFDFEVVYHGQGLNEPRTPVGDIYWRADHLALFAVTLGHRVTDEISRRFESNDPALAAMLDSAASIAADRLAEAAQHHFRDALAAAGWNRPGTGVLRYSPGYCGWHISGQKKLFEFLRPGQIGLSLRDSFLMEPLKSVSGVVIAGPREFHDVPDTYPFCSQCESHGCRRRIRALLVEPAVLNSEGS